MVSEKERVEQEFRTRLSIAEHQLAWWEAQLGKGVFPDARVRAHIDEERRAAIHWLTEIELLNGA